MKFLEIRKIPGKNLENSGQIQDNLGNSGKIQDNKI